MLGGTNPYCIFSKVKKFINENNKCETINENNFIEFYITVSHSDCLVQYQKWTIKPFNVHLILYLEASQNPKVKKSHPRENISMHFIDSMKFR